MDYVPTIFSFTKPPSDTVAARQSRLEKTRVQKEREEIEKEKAEQEHLEMELLEQEAVQGLLAMSLPSSVTSACMAAQLARVPLNGISATSLANDDGKTKFYTGLPMWTLFEQLFSLLSSHVTPSRTKLTLRDELVIVLVKLRLNLHFQDFAYRWEVSVPSH